MKPLTAFPLQSFDPFSRATATRFNAAVAALLPIIAAGVFGLANETSAAEIALEPGSPLATAFAITDDSARAGLNGAPPGPRGQIPLAPSEVGQHWLVLYTDDGRVERWLPFQVSAKASASDVSSARTLPLIVDREAPAASIRFSGAALDTPGGVMVGADVATRLTGSDRSGGVQLELLVDGEPAAEPWTTDRPDGSYTLAIRARDALGNRGQRDDTAVILDRTPPQLTWEQLNTIEGVPADVYDGRRTTLRIVLIDAGAGVSSARIGEQSLDQAQLNANAAELDLRGESLDYVLIDRVGNVRRGSIALRADREGPRLVARRDGERVEIDAGALSVQNRLALDAEDMLSGVDRACVEASIWYGECRELPVDLIGITPGKYSLRLRAVDRLGNRSKLKWTLEVTP